jgi:hypothetical protein
MSDKIKLVWVKNPNGCIHQQPENFAKNFVAEGAKIITDAEADKIQGIVNADAKKTTTPAITATTTTDIDPKTV